MSKDKKINIGKVTKIEQFGVAYNEKEFLLIFNSINEDFSDGEAFAIPAEKLKIVLDGLARCGVEYQDRFQRNLGFVREEE